MQLITITNRAARPHHGLTPSHSISGITETTFVCHPPHRRIIELYLHDEGLHNKSSCCEQTVAFPSRPFFPLGWWGFHAPVLYIVKDYRADADHGGVLRTDDLVTPSPRHDRIQSRLVAYIYTRAVSYLYCVVYIYIHLTSFTLISDRSIGSPITPDPYQ
jgi:hypothetical protein